MTLQPGPAITQADPLADARWRKAAASDANSGCVEVAFLLGGQVGVRDSKDRGTPALIVTAQAWASFLDRSKCGHFDLRP